MVKTLFFHFFKILFDTIFNVFCDSQYLFFVFRYFLSLRASRVFHLSCTHVWLACSWWVHCLLIIFWPFWSILNVFCDSQYSLCKSDLSTHGGYPVYQLFFRCFWSIFNVFWWLSTSVPILTCLPMVGTLFIDYVVMFFCDSQHLLSVSRHFLGCRASRKSYLPFIQF